MSYQPRFIEIDMYSNCASLCELQVTLDLAFRIMSAFVQSKRKLKIKLGNSKMRFRLSFSYRLPMKNGSLAMNKKARNIPYQISNTYRLVIDLKFTSTGYMKITELRLQFRV